MVAGADAAIIMTNSHPLQEIPMIEVTEVSIAELRARSNQAAPQRSNWSRPIWPGSRPTTAPRRHPLNAVVVPNPDALKEAQASDARRARGETLGPLDGIPYTAKDSYLVKGLTAASGSPAFKDLVAQRDAFTVERLRAAGAICLGKTNMPPMANGGMQRGVYGRAESPYNADYLTAPFASGSSNGAGTATAASFAAFGLAEETWSSGRGPASNNGLCAYTPSRGVISVRGNWPLTPTMDVVVPYARTMADLLEVLDVVVADDADTRGDLWRLQPWVQFPRPPRCVRLPIWSWLPRPMPSRASASACRACLSTRMNWPAPATTPASAARPVSASIPATVIALWEEARKALEAAGAEVIEVDFPLVSNCEGDRPGAPTVFNRGIVSPEFLNDELWELSGWAFDDFLRANGDPKLNKLADVDGPKIFPHDPGTLPNREGDLAAGMDEYVNMAKRGLKPLTRLPQCRTACAVWRRPASWIWKTGWTGSSSTPCCSPPSPTSARLMRT
jgi:amidase